MSGQPQVGDRVRVTYEGEYRRRMADGCHLLGVGCAVAQYAPADAVIEVLPKPIKVGDEITGERVAGLPRHSVVLQGEMPFIVTHDGRVSADSGARYAPQGDFTVLYIPD